MPLVLTKQPEDVFAPTTAGGAPRGANMAEAMVLTREMVNAINVSADVGSVSALTGRMSSAEGRLADMESDSVDLHSDVDEATATANDALAAATAGVVPPLTGVSAAQTTALPANTYANGTAGVGATITGNANGALATSYFDGISALSGTPRVFISLEGLKNGIYVVTQVGDASHPFILTRATDSDVAAELGFCNFSILAGSTLAGRRYQCQQKTADITVGTTALTFAQIGSDGALASEIISARGKSSTLGGALALKTDMETLHKAGFIKFIGSGDIVPTVVDMDEMRIVSAVSRSTGKALGSGATAATDTPLEDLPAAAAIADFNHAFISGESLSIGRKARPPLSTTAVYPDTNLMFVGGAKGGTLTSLVDLVEVDDAGADTGETPCSGIANLAETLARKMGKTRVRIASTGGLGGAKIADISSPATHWTTVTLAQVDAAYSLSTTYAMPILHMIIGANDASAGTTFADFRAAILAFRAALETYVNGKTGRSDTLYCSMSQNSSYVKTNADIALAILDICQTEDEFFLSTPLYPYAHADGVHLTNVGEKVVSGFHGIHEHAVVGLGKKPKWLNPLSSTWRALSGGGAEFRTKFDVPTLPMVIDIGAIGLATANGFVITDAGTPMTIVSSRVEGDEYVQVTSAEPTGTAVVRGGLDNLGSGLSVTSGASTNLRDSSTSSIDADGTKSMWNWCPHFKHTALKIGE